MDVLLAESEESPFLFIIGSAEQYISRLYGSIMGSRQFDVDFEEFRRNF